MAQNSDALNIGSSLAQGFAPSFMASRQNAQESAAAGSRAAALRQLKERQMGLEERERILPGPEAAKVLARFGMRWDPTKPLPVSALSALSGAYRTERSAGAAGPRDAARFRVDYPSYKAKALAEAMKLHGVDARLPIPSDKRAAVAESAANNMQSYIDAVNVERQDAGLSPAAYMAPDLPPQDDRGFFRRNADSFIGALMPGAAPPAPAAPAQVRKPAARKPAAAPPPLEDGWDIQEE